MPISGLVIRIDARQEGQIRASLADLPGVELQPAQSSGILVATLETDSFASEQSMTEQIVAVSGVSQVTVAYHNFEDMV